MAVAVVSGSNKGIGFAVVRKLCKDFQGDVYLTARNVERGETAIEELKAEGLKPLFHQLDIDDESSVVALRDFMQKKYGGIDVLVNNAGIAPEFYHSADHKTFGSLAATTLKTNYWATKRVCAILFPILRSGARVVNVSSSFGLPGCLRFASNTAKADELIAMFTSDSLTRDELDHLMTKFVESASAGTYEQHGWHSSPYSVSKIGLSALSRIQQRELSVDASRSDLVVSHVHPGYVDTDMTQHQGLLSCEQGAQSTVFAALLPRNTPIKGKFIWLDKQVIDWVGESSKEDPGQAWLEESGRQLFSTKPVTAETEATN